MFASNPLSGIDSGFESASAGLTAWNFLEDLDVGFDSVVDDLALQQPANPQTTNQERIKEKNRIAQKRFRQRKKERSETIEAQLATTTSQLHALKLRQRQLEARNDLLEKVAALNKQQSFQDTASVSTGAPSTRLNKWQAETREVILHALENSGLRRTQQGQALVLTVHGIEQEMQLEDIGMLSLKAFAKLYTAFACKMAECLLDVSDDSVSSNPSLVCLRRWSLECSGLAMCFCLGNPDAVTHLNFLNMQTGELFQAPAPDDFHTKLLEILRFTDSQQQDMLYLRRLFYGKLGQLARERASILQQVDAAEPSGQPSQPMPFNLGFRHTVDKLTEAKELADQLCANRAEESRTYMYCVVCLYRCIQSSLQHAKMLVHPFPRAADMNQLLDALAQQHKEPSIVSLLEPSGVDDLQHAANWAAVIQCVQSLDENNVHGHTPLLKDLAGTA
ncbi:hypothetical protein WJX79_009497 [Trebouxia sp. C0005]|nr:MAG: hypothetical protein FRX49_06708 [Trebouxia sp. A1-2]